MSKDKDKQMSIEEWKKIVGDIEALGYTVLDDDDETTNEEEEDNE